MSENSCQLHPFDSLATNLSYCFIKSLDASGLMGVGEDFHSHWLCKADRQNANYLYSKEEVHNHRINLLSERVGVNEIDELTK
ncbi:MAG: hypothetical protein OEM52_03635 [bacterium]|nr:hypothetical protein [bacterium]